MDPLLIIAVAMTALVAIALVLVVNRARGEAANRQRMAEVQAELIGRVAQLTEAHNAGHARMAELMQNQEREMSKRLDERLAEVGKRVGESLEKSSTQAQTSLSELKERLAVIDAAQKNLTELSGQVTGLQDILANKQARGAFGEIQLEDIVRSALPPNSYEFQATLSNNRRADCLLKLPNPPGAIVIDAKFPLESYRALREAGDDAARQQARRGLATAVQAHVKDIAERYIVAGETAESALMFLPSEAVYAELHANLPQVIEQSFRQRVWIVSPTTLMATLNTVRAVLKDVRMREQAHVIQKEVGVLMTDLGRLDKRIGSLETHFQQAEKDIREIRISANKISRRGERIEEIELGEDPATSLSMESQEEATKTLLNKS